MGPVEAADCSLEELAYASALMAGVKSSTVICVAHARPLSEDLLPNTEIERGSLSFVRPVR